MTKLSHDHNIPSGIPEKFRQMVTMRMQSANLCRQAVPPALLHLGNVLLYGPQSSLETTTVLVLILCDLAQKKEVLMENKTFAEK